MDGDMEIVELRTHQGKGVSTHESKQVAGGSQSNIPHAAKGGRDAEKGVRGHKKDKVPCLIAFSMTFTGLWSSSCSSCCPLGDSSNNSPDYLSKAEFWSPTETQGQNTAEAQGQNTAEAQGQNTAEAQGQNTAEAQGQNTAEAQGQNTAEAQGQNTAEAQGQNTAEAQGQNTAEAQGQMETGDEQQREGHGHYQADNQGRGGPNWKVIVFTIYQIVIIPILLFLTAFFVVDIIFFVIYTKFGNEYLLDTASFLCLNFQTFLLIKYTTITRLTLCFRRGRPNPDLNAMPYDKDTCTRRVALVQAFYNTSGKCYLRSCCKLALEILMFFFFPLVNTVLQLAFGFLVFFIGCESKWQMATLVIKSVLYIYYGCFWYVVYVQRVYLNCKLNNTIATIRKLAGQNRGEDNARRLIDRIYSEFHVVRYFTGWLMAFTLLTVTFHSLCCAILAYCKLSMVTSRNIVLQIMLLSQNIMFLCVPIYAIGGMNLESLWTKFRHVLFKCKVQGQIEFWNDVWNYATQIDTLASFPLAWTGIFPILGAILTELFARRDSISLEYWSYLSNCNDSMESNTCLV